MRKILLACGLLLVVYSTSLAQRVIRMVYFDFEKHELTSATLIVLNHMSDSFLQKFEIKSIDLRGHTDSIGRAGFNDSLSERRANTIKGFFANLHIADTLIKQVKGYGKTKPLNKNRNEADRQANRRVEILIQYGRRKNTIPPVKAEIQGPKEISGKIDTSMLQMGERLVLRNINFEGGRHVFLPSSHNSLKELLESLKANLRLEIEILGYICCSPENAGDGQDFDTGKWNLSEARAKAVYDFLVKNGISEKRLLYKGMGATNRITEERTEEEKTTNRRVEAVVLRK